MGTTIDDVIAKDPRADKPEKKDEKRMLMPEDFTLKDAEDFIARCTPYDPRVDRYSKKLQYYRK